MRVSFLIAAAAAATTLRAQSTLGTTVTYDLTAQVIGGNGSFPMEPGESCLFRISVSFTNQNTTATFSPPIGTFGSGTIRGFGSGFIDLYTTGPVGGTWDVSPANGHGPISDWDLVGPGGYGTPANGGRELNAIQFGQFPVNPNQILTTNPIPIYSALWTPASNPGNLQDFTIRANVAAQGNPSSVFFRLSPTLVGSALCPSTFGHVTVDLGTPAPSTLSLIALAGFVAPRRRR